MGWDVKALRNAVAGSWPARRVKAAWGWLVPPDRPIKGLAAALCCSLVIIFLSILIAWPLARLAHDEIVAWVQAVGAILAIVSGFAIALYQRSEARSDAKAEIVAIAHAAQTLAWHALETVGERLDSILNPADSITLALRGDRTAEMVAAMREFDTARLPPALLSDFIQLRSHVHAMNGRISELYRAPREADSEGKTRHQKLASTVRAHAGARAIYADLARTTAAQFGAPPLPLTAYPRIENYAPGAPRLI